MEFTLTRQLCRVAHLNIREEKHGDEPVLGVDLKLVADLPNSWLLYLHSDLRSSLYARPENDLFPDEPGHYPRLRFAAIPVIHWDETADDMELVIDPEVGPEIRVEAKVDKIKLECRDGGTVIMSFRAQLSPTPEQVGRLSALLGHDVKVTACPADGEPAGDGGES